LYNVEKDPLELRNLYQEEQALGSAMAEKLKKYIGGIRSARSLTPAKLDREALDSLRSLGYIQ
jgi:hypothetical protein